MASDLGYNRKCVLYVGNLEETVNEDALYNAFIPFGDVTCVDLPRETHVNRHRTYAFVEFDDPDDAAHALENMHECDFYGRVLKVSIAKPGAIKNRGMWEQGRQEQQSSSSLMQSGDEVHVAMLKKQKVEQTIV